MLKDLSCFKTNECTRIHLKHHKGVQLDFGSKDICIYTWYSAWRFIKDDLLYVSNNQFGLDLKEVSKRLEQLPKLEFESISMLNDFDVSVHFNNNIRLDILCDSSDVTDEVVCFFCDNHIYVSYTCAKEWITGKSNVPGG
tara:strand:+ start:195 stop:614 length:420 start_codon:yes stop_codon:yes gene_type:complete